MAYGITEYPNSFKRQDAFPLDYYSKFETLNLATEYAAKNPVAYDGQIISVVENSQIYILQKNENYDSSDINSNKFTLVQSSGTSIPIVGYWFIGNNSNNELELCINSLLPLSNANNISVNVEFSKTSKSTGSSIDLIHSSTTNTVIVKENITKNNLSDYSYALIYKITSDLGTIYLNAGSILQCASEDSNYSYGTLIAGSDSIIIGPSTGGSSNESDGSNDSNNSNDSDSSNNLDNLINLKIGSDNIIYTENNVTSGVNNSVGTRGFEIISYKGVNGGEGYYILKNNVNSVSISDFTNVINNSKYSVINSMNCDYFGDILEVSYNNDSEFIGTYEAVIDVLHVIDSYSGSTYVDTADLDKFSHEIQYADIYIYNDELEKYDKQEISSFETTYVTYDNTPYILHTWILSSLDLTIQYHIGNISIIGGDIEKTYKLKMEIYKSLDDALSIKVNNFYSNDGQIGDYVEYNSTKSYSNKGKMYDYAPELGYSIQLRENDSTYFDQACLYICGHPELGTKDLYGLQTSFGAGNVNQAEYSFISGLNNLGFNKYGAIFGRNNIAGFGCFIAGRNNNLGFSQVCQSLGDNNNVGNFSSHSSLIGRWLNSNYSFQHVIGKFNNNKERNVLEIGYGSGENSRKNIFEVDKDGNLYLNEVKAIMETEIVDTIDTSIDSFSKGDLINEEYSTSLSTDSLENKLSKQLYFRTNGSILYSNLNLDQVYEVNNYRYAAYLGVNTSSFANNLNSWYCFTCNINIHSCSDISKLRLQAFSSNMELKDSGASGYKTCTNLSLGDNIVHFIFTPSTYSFIGPYLNASSAIDFSYSIHNPKVYKLNLIGKLNTKPTNLISSLPVNQGDYLSNFIYDNDASKCVYVINNECYLSYDESNTNLPLNLSLVSNTVKRLNDSIKRNVFKKILSTNWTTYDVENNIKQQILYIDEIKSTDDVLIDHDNYDFNYDNSYANYKEVENQFVSRVLNGWADVEDGRIVFNIFGDETTVDIPLIIKII